MKKKVIVIILFCCICLIGCKQFKYSYHDLKENITKIEIIEIINYNANDIKLLKELSDEESDLLLQNLAKVKFNYPIGDPYGLRGIGIKLYYSDQEYEIITQLTTKRFKDEIEVAWYKRECSKEDFNSLILSHI